MVAYRVKTKQRGSKTVPKDVGSRICHIHNGRRGSRARTSSVEVTTRKLGRTKEAPPATPLVDEAPLRIKRRDGLDNESENFTIEFTRKPNELECDALKNALIRDCDIFIYEMLLRGPRLRIRRRRKVKEYACGPSQITSCIEQTLRELEYR